MRSPLLVVVVFLVRQKSEYLENELGRFHLEEYAGK